MDAASIERETRTWSTVLHLSLFAGYVVPLAGWVVPIIIWQLKKDDLPEIDAHGRHAVNWLISLMVYGTVFGLLSLVFIGIPMVIVLGVLSVLLPIVAAIKAAGGQAWKYPGTLPLF